MGRKGLWYILGINEKLPQIEDWYKQGALDQDVARSLGVSLRTLMRWKHRFPQFTETVVTGKSPADQGVINATYRNCVGYEYFEEKFEDVFNKDGKYLCKKKTVTRKFFPGTPADRRMWLVNRCDWRFKADIEIIENPLDDVENWTPERKQRFIESGGQDVSANNNGD